MVEPRAADCERGYGSIMITVARYTIDTYVCTYIPGLALGQ